MEHGVNVVRTTLKGNGTEAFFLQKPQDPAGNERLAAAAARRSYQDAGGGYSFFFFIFVFLIFAFTIFPFFILVFLFFVFPAFNYFVFIFLNIFIFLIILIFPWFPVFYKIQFQASCLCIKTAKDRVKVVKLPDHFVVQDLSRRTAGKDPVSFDAYDPVGNFHREICLMQGHDDRDLLLFCHFVED